MNKQEKCKEDLPIFVEKEGFTGIAMSDTHDLIEKETVLAEVQILKCKDCGKESVSWRRKYKDN